MHTVKVGNRIVALDSIAMVEYSDRFAHAFKDREKESERYVGTCFLKVKEKTTPYISRKHAVSLPQGWTVTPIDGGNVTFNVTQPEYEKLVWALEAFNALRRD